MLVGQFSFVYPLKVSEMDAICCDMTDCQTENGLQTYCLRDCRRLSNAEILTLAEQIVNLYGLHSGIFLPMPLATQITITFVLLFLFY